LCEIYEVLSADIQNIKNLPLKFVIKMFYHRLYKREEQKAWQMYLMRYQHMDSKTFKPFETAKSKVKISTKSAEEILTEAENIQIKLSKKGG
jgi:hypothetical protein